MDQTLELLPSAQGRKHTVSYIVDMDVFLNKDLLI